MANLLEKENGDKNYKYLNSKIINDNDLNGFILHIILRYNQTI